MESKKKMHNQKGKKKVERYLHQCCEVQINNEFHVMLWKA